MATRSRFALIGVTAALVLAATYGDAAPKRAVRTSRAATGSGPDVYGGYSYTHAGQASLQGWTLAGAYPLRSSLRLVVDLSGHYGSYGGASLSQTALMAGVRRTWSWRRLTPFVDGVGGFARAGTSAAGLSATDTLWGIGLGGGADYPVSGRWAARGLVQLRLLHGQGAWDKDPRLSIGAVYQFDR